MYTLTNHCFLSNKQKTNLRIYGRFAYIWAPHPSEENTLDLIFTNEANIIIEVEVNKSAISDHNRIEVNTNYRIKEEILQQNTQKIDNTMRSLNVHLEEKIN